MLRLPSLALAFAAALALSACSRGDPDEEVDWPPPDPLIYEIANADGEVEGWLLGTIHALPDGLEWRTDTITSVADEADLLMVEVAELNDSGMLAATFSSLATTPGLGPLEPRIDPALHETLETMLDRSAYSRADFTDTEDWAAAIMLARVDAAGDPRNGVDKALITEFDNREVLGFESAAGQLGIFDRLASEDQQALLEGTLREWASSRDDPAYLLKAWLTGDVATLEAATNAGIMADPELREALLTGRNEDWIGPLTETLEDDAKPLVAVGAAHIVGPDGLTTMLEARGYSLRRLP